MIYQGDKKTCYIKTHIFFPLLYPMIPISVKIINPNIESFKVNPKFEHNLYEREVKITNLPSILSWDKHKKPVYIYYSYIDINT